MATNALNPVDKYIRTNDAHFGKHNGFACRLERAGHKEWAAHYRWKSIDLWMRRHKATEIRPPPGPLQHKRSPTASVSVRRLTRSPI